MAHQRILTEPEEKELWQGWAQHKDVEARRQLIEHYLPFAQILAAKLYAGRQVQQVDFHEYRQYAILGMIEAVDRFDVLRNISFKTYAGHRITGAVLNGIEKCCEKQQQITARASLRQERVASLKESEKKNSQDDLFAELADLAIGLALGYMLEDSGMYLNQEDHYTENFYDRHELSQIKQAVVRIVDMLPEQARCVIRYHYFQGLNFQEIAGLMMLTKGRISQIHRQALKALQEVYLNSEGLNLKL